MTPGAPARATAETVPAPRAGGDPLIRLFHVSKSYAAGTFALRDVSMTCSSGPMTTSVDSPRRKRARPPPVPIFSTAAAVPASTMVTSPVSRCSA